MLVWHLVMSRFEENWNTKRRLLLWSESKLGTLLVVQKDYALNCLLPVLSLITSWAKASFSSFTRWAQNHQPKTLPLTTCVILKHSAALILPKGQWLPFFSWGWVRSVHAGVDVFFHLFDDKVGKRGHPIWRKKIALQGSWDSSIWRDRHGEKFRKYMFFESDSAVQFATDRRCARRCCVYFY